MELGAFIHECIDFQLSQPCASKQVILIFLKLILLRSKREFIYTWLNMVAFSHLPRILEGLFPLSVIRQISDHFFLTGKKCAVHGVIMLCPRTQRSAMVTMKTLKNHQSNLLLSVLADWINQVSYCMLMCILCASVWVHIFMRHHRCNNSTENAVSFPKLLENSIEAYS